MTNMTRNWGAKEWELSALWGDRAMLKVQRYIGILERVFNGLCLWKALSDCRRSIVD